MENKMETTIFYRGGIVVIGYSICLNPKPQRLFSERVLA